MSESAGNEADEGITERVPAGGAKAEGVPPARVVLRDYLSSHFLWTAEHTSALAAAIEDAHVGEPRFDPEHRAYVLSSIIASASFAEASINEIYQDAHDGHGLVGDGYLAPLEPRTIEALKATWLGTSEGRSLGSLERWQLLLIHAGAQPLDRGGPPYQDAQLVFRLRNALVHYKPEDVAADWVHRLEERLKGKFASNRLMNGSPNPWWPDHCLGHGCSEWAAQSVVAFTDYVSDAVGLRLNYRRVFDPDNLARAPGPPASPAVCGRPGGIAAASGDSR